MTLRHQVSLILPFGEPVGPDHKFYDFRRTGFASPSFGGFAFVGSLAAVAQFSVRPMTLRHRVFPVLLFLGATLLLHFLIKISITQMFYKNWVAQLRGLRERFLSPNIEKEKRINTENTESTEAFLRFFSVLSVISVVKKP